MDIKETYIIGTITDENDIITGYLYLDYTLMFWFLAGILILQIAKLFKK